MVKNDRPTKKGLQLCLIIRYIITKYWIQSFLSNCFLSIQFFFLQLIGYMHLSFWMNIAKIIHK